MECSVNLDDVFTEDGAPVPPEQIPTAVTAGSLVCSDGANMVRRRERPLLIVVDIGRIVGLRFEPHARRMTSTATSSR
jgi:hypothetical protein